MNCLNTRHRQQILNKRSDLVPWDAGPFCEQRMRISRRAGENALFNLDMMRDVTVTLFNAGLNHDGRETPAG